MAHTWKHKKQEETFEQYPHVKKFLKSKKRDRTAEHEVDYSLDLGELDAAGVDVDELYKGTTLNELEERIKKKERKLKNKKF